LRRPRPTQGCTADDADADDDDDDDENKYLQGEINQLGTQNKNNRGLFYRGTNELIKCDHLEII
jgi:hypothetical protein